MARFEGAGALYMSGNYTRIYDCEFANATGVADALVVTADRAIVQNCTFLNMEVGVDIDGNDCLVTGCYISTIRIGVNVSGSRNIVTTNRITISAPDPSGAGVLLNSGVQSLVAHNHIACLEDDTFGIEVNDEAVIIGNTIVIEGTDSDGIMVLGNEALVTNNKITPGANTPRNGINIDAAGNDNIVVSNDLGDASGYSGAALIDSGTATQLTYPAGAFGDNFSI